jgi:hypothetical protein
MMCVSALAQHFSYESHLLYPFKNMAEESFFGETMKTSNYTRHVEKVRIV